LKEEIITAYGDEPEKSPDFARIVNVKNWNRLTAMIDDDKVIFGGQSNESDCYIATLINEYDIDSLIMKKIFGPLLPILEYSSDADIYTIVSKYENHCLYTFYGK
jgi:aldehyde dehydrogenase (NAD+)